VREIGLPAIPLEGPVATAPFISMAPRPQTWWSVFGAGVVAGLLAVLGAVLNRNPDARTNLHL